MPAHLSAGQARALGLVQSPRNDAQRKTRREASGPYLTRCVTCHQEFDTRAAEDRHVNQTRHARYEALP